MAVYIASSILIPALFNSPASLLTLSTLDKSQKSLRYLSKVYALTIPAGLIGPAIATVTVYGISAKAVIGGLAMGFIATILSLAATGLLIFIGIGIAIKVVVDAHKNRNNNALKE